MKFHFVSSFKFSLVIAQVVVAQWHNSSTRLPADQTACPSLSKCLGDQVGITEVTCASLHSLLITAWKCTQVQNGQQQTTFTWRDDDQTGNCLRLSHEYPELNEILRCHNDFYDKIVQMHKDACLLELSFVKCMGWPIAELISCDGGIGAPSLSGSHLVLDLQLPHKKNLVDAQNTCVKFQLNAERECMREGLEKCNRADVQPRPTGFAESKMDKCLKLKAGKETEAVKRADLAIAQIQETLSFCLDGAESQLLARIRQTLSLPQNQKFP